MAKLTKYTTGIILAVAFVIFICVASIAALLYLVAYMKNMGV